MRQAIFVASLLICSSYVGALEASQTETAAAPQAAANVSAAPEESMLVVDIPEDFEWDTYIAYHPHLFNRGITTEVLAKEHYSTEGWMDRLLYKRLQVFLRYTACTGLINQLYSHIAAISLGAMLGAEIVLPAAAIRDSFAHYFSVFKEQNEVLWSPAPLETLLDVDAIIDFWGQKGLSIHKAQALEPFPDLTQSQTAYINFPHIGANEGWSVELGGVYSTYRDLEELVELASKAVIHRAEEIQLGDDAADVSHIVLDLPCTFFMLRTQSNIHLVSEVAKSLTWAPSVQSLADRIVEGILKDDNSPFNTLHLRIEKDARDWMAILGGREAVWQSYVDSMRLAGFNATTRVYIASGLLSYESSEELDGVIEAMKTEGVCQSAVYKEMYVGSDEIIALNSEQKALVDFLVLMRGRSFVGLGSSTFSYYLREYRTLMGIPKSLSVLVDASVIGTDQMFAEAATLS